MRRRARFLRKARELAYRDLGGLVFNLHRFGQRNDTLVLAKLNLISQMDSELRTLEAALRERRPITVLREAGITACPRCAAIHSSEDHFCPNCGLSVGRHADLPIGGVQAGAGTPAGAQPGARPDGGTQPAPAPGPPHPERAAAPATGTPPAGNAAPAGPTTQVFPGPAGPAPRTSPAPAPAASPARGGAEGPGGRPADSSGSRGRSPSPPSFDAPQAFPAAPAGPEPAEPPPTGGDHDPPAAGEDTEILRPSQGS